MRHHDGAHAQIAGRVIAIAEQAQFGADLLQRDAGSYSPGRIRTAVLGLAELGERAAVGANQGERAEWHPDGGRAALRAGERGRRYADNRERHVVEAQFAPDHIAGTAEPAVPELGADHRHGPRRRRASSFSTKPRPSSIGAVRTRKKLSVTSVMRVTALA